MTGFGDYEPEDAWDADDPTPVLVTNLFRRLELLEQTGGTAGDLDELDRRLTPIRNRRGELTPRELLRLEQLDIDIAYLRNRGDG